MILQEQQQKHVFLQFYFFNQFKLKIANPRRDTSIPNDNVGLPSSTPAGHPDTVLYGTLHLAQGGSHRHHDPPRLGLDDSDHDDDSPPEGDSDHDDSDDDDSEDDDDPPPEGDDASDDDNDDSDDDDTPPRQGHPQASRSS